MTTVSAPGTLTPGKSGWASGTTVARATPPTRSGLRDVVRGGDHALLGAQHGRGLLLEILRPTGRPGRPAAARAFVTAETPGTGASREEAAPAATLLPAPPP